MMLYHCGIPQHWVNDEGWADIEFLCGADKSLPHSWDPPYFFIHHNNVSKGEVRCQECLEHPDIPLLLLGTLP